MHSCTVQGTIAAFPLHKPSPRNKEPLQFHRRIKINFWGNPFAPAPGGSTLFLWCADVAITIWNTKLPRSMSVEQMEEEGLWSCVGVTEVEKLGSTFFFARRLSAFPPFRCFPHTFFALSALHTLYFWVSLEAALWLKNYNDPSSGKRESRSNVSWQPIQQLLWYFSLGQTLFSWCGCYWFTVQSR